MLYFVWHSLFFTTFPVPLSPLKSFHEWIREGSAAFSWEATSYRWPHRHETFTAARIWLLSLHCSSVAKLPTKFHRKEGTLRGCVFPHLSVCMSVSVCLSVCLSVFLSFFWSTFEPQWGLNEVSHYHCIHSALMIFFYLNNQVFPAGVVLK